jgi:RNA recognition motif-containing protein
VEVTSSSVPDSSFGCNFRKAKLDDDDDEDEDLIRRPIVMTPSVQWHVPAVLPAMPDVTQPVLESTETGVQNLRMKSAVAVRYVTSNDVPPNPAALSDFEQSADMTSQSSAVVTVFPFIVAPAREVPVSVPPPAQPSFHAPTSAAPVVYGVPPPPVVDSTVATADFVQSLGLPMSLVGQSKQALLILAGSPGLLSTLVDGNGMYDEARLLTLVQTLSASQVSQHRAITPAVPSYAPVPLQMMPVKESTTFGAQMMMNNVHIPAPIARSDAGNLHVAGYGPDTTQSDLINLFSQYVIVDEVVMKGTFAFVNTADPFNAQRAREILNGYILNGGSLSIKPATRKNKESSAPYATPSAPSGPGGLSPSILPTATLPPPSIPSSIVPMQTVLPLTSASGATMLLPSANLDNERDERGNIPTKNLFVAGYGPGTTEQQLRSIFNQYATVIGVVNKGSFSFVNTLERYQAVNARNFLNGSNINGGTVRINFAKETGRLGTSFDLTYGVNTGPHARRNQGPPPLPGTSRVSAPPSYYGRGY